HWIRTNPQFSWQMHRAFSRQANIRDIVSVQSRCISPQLRFEQLLWRLLCVQNGGQAATTGRLEQRECKLLIPRRRHELAKMVSITPEHFSRLLRQMEEDGIIRRDNGFLIIPSPETLWRAPEIQSLTGADPMLPNVPDLPEIIVA